VSRDKDLLDLRSDPDFCMQFPNLTVVDPVEFLRVNREYQATPDQIAAWLRMFYNYAAASRIDVTLTGEGTFQATLVNADGTVEKTIDGSFKRSGGRLMLAPLEQPDLSLEQWKVYDEILRDFTDKLRTHLTQAGNSPSAQRTEVYNR
jgi:hypothetical protein